MEIILNIDVWLSPDGGIFTKPQKSEGFVHIPAGEKIEHKEDGLFIRRIKDVKIIFNGADLPKIENGPEWGWQGFGSPDRPELQGSWE